MPTRRRSPLARVYPTTSAAVLAAVTAAGVGCAHHRADQYAYAPPYAPPVYPQPQISGVPPVAIAPGPVPMTAAAPATITSAAVPTGAVPAMDGVVPAVGGVCPPCATGEGMIVPTSGFVDGGGQTPPCPPGH